MIRRKILRRSVVPHNTLVHATVPHQLRHYGDIEAHKTHNAIRASGITAWLFPHLKRGRKCTCEQSFSLLDPDSGSLTPEGFSKIMETAYDDSEESDAPTFTANDLDFSGSSLIHESIEVEEDDDIESFSFEGTQCGICYGTGWQGGFSIDGGYKRVYTSLDCTTQSVITSSFPNKIKAGSLEFGRMPIHTGFNRIFRVYDNMEIIDPEDYTISVTPVLSIQCVKDFTHIEVVWHPPLGGSTYIDMPQLPDNLRPKLKESQINTEIYLTSSQFVPNFSVFYENKYNRHWQITEITPHKAYDKRVIFWEGQCRLVQEHENINQLYKGQQ